jgi:hydrogenase maturation protease
VTVQPSVKAPAVSAPGHGPQRASTPQPVLVLGIGNVLWADEGFGVRCVEALHAAPMPAAEHVQLVDGGTQGMYLLDAVCEASRVLVLDAIDYGLPPGTLKVLRDARCRCGPTPR